MRGSTAVQGTPSRVGRDALLLGLGAGVLYVSLAQSEPYLFDGLFFVARVEAGQLTGVTHFLMHPTAWVAHRLLAPLGVSLWSTAGLLSALGAALGVALFFTAQRRLGATAACAWQSAALLATAIPVVFFATHVEYHGFFLAFAGLAAVATGRLAQRPSLPGALLFAGCILLAFLAHASGFLLAPWLATLAALHARQRAPGAGWRAWTAMPALALLAAGLMVAAVPRVMAVFGTPLLVAPGHAHWAITCDRLAVGHRALLTFGREWLWACAPCSVVALLALGARRARAPGLALMVGLVPTTLMAYVVLDSGFERGAYFLPLLWPAAWATALCAGRLAYPIAAITLTVALAINLQERAGPTTAAIARDLDAAMGSRPGYVFVGEPAELGACLLHTRRGAHLLHHESWLTPGQLAAALPLFDSWLNALLADGGCVLVSATALRLLQEPRPDLIGPTGPLIAAHLAEAYRLLPVQAATFRGFRLARRDG